MKSFQSEQRQIPPFPESIDDLPIQTDEIRNSAFAIEELIKVLRPQIEEGRYGLVVVDQMSGHVPGFIIGDVINAVRSRKYRPIIPIVPIDGEKKEAGLERMKAEFAQKRPVTKTLSRSERVLLVTEYVSHGDTLRNYSKVFGGNGFQFDVASLVLSEPNQYYYANKTVPPDTNIFAAYQDYDPPPGSRNYDLIGYSRDQAGNIIRGRNMYLPIQAKADSKLLANYFVSKYFS